MTNSTCGVLNIWTLKAITQEKKMKNEKWKMDQLYITFQCICVHHTR